MALSPVSLVFETAGQHYQCYHMQHSLNDGLWKYPFYTLLTGFRQATVSIVVRQLYSRANAGRRGVTSSYF
jgi:hypothetical protein